MYLFMYVCKLATRQCLEFMLKFSYHVGSYFYDPVYDSVRKTSHVTSI